MQILGGELDDFVAGLVLEASPPTLEEVLTLPEWGFALETATPVQRALCRLSEGLPADLEGWSLGDGYPEEVVERCSLDWMVGRAVGEKPREVVLLAGIRTGKSLLAAALAVHACLTVDLSELQPWEVGRFSVLSLSKDNARVVYEHLLGALARSPKLRAMVVGEPRAESLLLRRPTGETVEITVVAGKRAGGSLVSRWSIGVVFDEAPRMIGSEEGVVNLDESRRAVLERLKKGAQIWMIGSPWAPIGPVYEVTEQCWQREGEVLVFRAPAPALNPYWWTPERVSAAQGRDAQTYRTDILADFGDLETSALSDAVLQSNTREARVLPPEEGVTYYAEMDPAMRGNGWPVVVGGITQDGLRTIARAWEERSVDGQPLRPLEVMRRIAEELAVYGVTTVGTDQYAADALVDIGLEVGIQVVPETITAVSKRRDFEGLAALLLEERCSLPPVTLLQRDLRSVRRRLVGDTVRIVYPDTADGRHCDYAGPVAKLLTRDMAMPEVIESEIPDGWTKEEWEDVKRIDERRRDEGLFAARSVFE